VLLAALERRAADESTPVYNPNIATAAKPLQPIRKGLPGPGLLGYIITGKLGDHLPLYRLEKIFARLEVKISRGTMCGWLAAAANWSRPLVERMTARIRLSRVVHTDDTTVPVLPSVEDRVSRHGNPCKKAASGPISAIRTTRTSCTTTRPTARRAGPANWLKRLQRLSAAERLRRLRRDISLRREGSRLVGRTRAASSSTPRRRMPSAPPHLLTLVGQLYAVEDEVKEFSDDERSALRPIAQRAGVGRDQDLARRRRPARAAAQSDGPGVYLHSQTSGTRCASIPPQAS